MKPRQTDPPSTVRDALGELGRTPVRDTVGSVAHAREINTLSDAASTFWRSSSGRVIGSAVLVGIAVRVSIGSPSWRDAVGVAAVVILLGPVEWIVHRRLLHAPESSSLARRLGTRASHIAHHRDPDDLDWLLLRRLNAIGSCAAIVVPIVGCAAAMSLVLGLDAAAVAPVAATLAVGSLIALLHYEWVHLLVHARYRCRTSYYARLERNHRWHHYRNEDFWLGVTVDLGDRLAGTLPTHRSDVPLSPTARSLTGAAGAPPEEVGSDDRSQPLTAEG